jgi:hypothetical protein
MFSSGSSPEEMDQLDQVFDLLNKREAMRLVARACVIDRVHEPVGVIAGRVEQAE